ncbi:hypothetical protein NDU88_004007 [Pleurodeles waltl]|uniref:Uncharacterized protein n=1 Tax=Pleurodeles waltl TaxID=8319 RepID=A0AAV7V1Q4_PLEWA|nr:hypothetical protein NDU88_004007 [Pleurodeles waltl]
MNPAPPWFRRIDWKFAGSASGEVAGPASLLPEKWSAQVGKSDLEQQRSKRETARVLVDVVTASNLDESAT